MLTTKSERVAGYVAKYVSKSAYAEKPAAPSEALRYEGRRALCRTCDRIDFYLESSAGLRYCDAHRHELRCVCGELETRAHDCAETWEWI